MAKKKPAPVEPEKPSLRLEWRSPAELAENPRNWRTHPEAQVAALADTLAEVGWAGACLYNETTGRLIDGHARKKVAMDQGSDRVPVLVGSWTEEQEAKILATLDPIGAMAGADAAKLDALLREVQTGSSALGAMLTELAAANPPEPALPTPGGGGDDFDPTPAQGPTRCQIGDLWLIGGKHRLLVGDCTVRENVERLMGRARASVVVTDPPYAVDYVDKARDMNARGYGHSRGKSAAAIQGDGIDDEQAESLWRASLTVAHEQAAQTHAAWYIWHAQGRAMLTLYNLLAELGFLHHQTIIWVKNGFVIGRCDYQWQHEPCWYGWMKGDRPKYIGEKSQSTVWAESRDTNVPEHPTQKPLECMARPIRNHGAAGDVVYDPFLGSGTTLIAAHRLGRLCYGCEIECRYGDVVLKRAEAEGLTCERVEHS